MMSPLRATHARAFWAGGSMLTRRARGPAPSGSRLAVWPALLLRGRCARVLAAVRVAGVTGPVTLARPICAGAVATTVVAPGFGVQALLVVDIVSASRVPRRPSVVTPRVVSACLVVAP